jgi:hypothetical protein
MKQSLSWPFHRHLFGIRSQASAHVLKALPSKISTKTVQNATLLIQKKKERKRKTSTATTTPSASQKVLQLQNCSIVSVENMHIRLYTL